MEMEEENIENVTIKRKKALFLFSSATGSPKKQKKLPKVFAALEPYYELDIRKTSSMEEGQSLALESCGHYDSLIVYGGDGTLNHIASVLAEREDAPVLGYLPGGTLNDGGKNYGVDSIKKGVRILQEGAFGRFDLVKVGKDYSTYLAGFGPYMDVSYVAKRKVKKALGKLVYYLICIKEMFSIRKYHLKVEGDGQFEGKASILAAMNGRWIGGMRTNSKGKANDGKLELLILRPTIFNGFFCFFFHFGFLRLSGERFHVSVDKPVEWCVDGELGPTGDLDIELKKGALKIYCDSSLL